MRFSFPGTEDREGPVRVLLVCTGNICRSPLAALLLRKEVADLPIVVSSAGTHALEGHQMTEQNQRIAESNGAVYSYEHRARQLTSDMIKNSDLVLALSREHRSYIVNLVPRASRYTFTLREFGRLAAAFSHQPNSVIQKDITPEGIRNAIQGATKLRGTLPLLDNPTEDDVVDPYRKKRAIYEQSAAQLLPSVSDIAKLISTPAMGVK